MNTIQEYINSGILEEYVLGLTSPEETVEVSAMAQNHPEIKAEIESITTALQNLSAKNIPKINPTLRTSVLATVDFTERLKSGEPMENPPLLSEKSKSSDYQEWIDRPEMVLPEEFNDSYAKIIGANEQATTMIVWLTTGAPHEVHDNEYERFLILEGSCEITIANETHHLKAGDYLQIPLHIGHHLIVTSEIPCKVILQRVAA
jgi:mannose-6-phosphate isomerase-like protein (cupin superfamily)